MKTYVYDPRTGRIVRADPDEDTFAKLTTDMLVVEGMIGWEMEWREIREIHVSAKGRQIELML